MLNKYTIFFPTAVSVILLDQITKAYITSAMALYDSFSVINGFLNLTYVRNPGAAFGFLANASARFRAIFFVAVSLLALGLILYYVVRSEKTALRLHSALALIFGGAVGNLIDRLRFGDVVDFIDVHWKTYHWPAFNVADAAISVGALLMILNMVRKKSEDGVDAEKE